MKKYIYILPIIIAGFFLLSFLTTSQASENENTKSIHQLELESHPSVHSNTLFNPPAMGGEITPYNPAASPGLNKEVFGFHPYWMGDTYKDYQYNLLSTIGYFAVKIDPSGTISNKNEWPHYNLINTAHKNGVRVVLVARNFNTSEITSLLSSSTNRNRAINNLYKEVKNAGADGINIDLEGVSGSQKGNLTKFMKGLTSKFHSGIPGSKVTISTPAVDWSDAFDFEKLAAYTDGMLIMGYDYHYSGSSQAGPVAPLNGGGIWNGLSVSNTINTYLKYAPAGKLILGVPYYGYEWEVDSANVPTDTVSSGQAKSYATIVKNYSNYSNLWDSTSSTPYKKYSNKQLWFDNSSSLKKKYDLVNNKNLQGIGIWALGYDNGRSELWDAIESKFEEVVSLNKYISIVTGAGPGGGPHVRAFDVYGNVKSEPNNLFPYPENFRGGVNVSLGDINGDKVSEIFTGPKPGGGPQARIFKKDGTAIGFIWPFHPDSRTGINIANGDINGDGKDEVVVSQAENGHAWVKVYKNNTKQSIVGEWNAYGNVECGASVAMGDVDGDGKDEIITGAGSGGGPHVRVFEADGLVRTIGFMAFHPDYRGGIDVAAGDVDGDGRDEIGVCQKTEQAWCKVYEFNSKHTQLGEWKAYGDFEVGASIDMGDIDSDGKAEVVTGAGYPGGPQVRAFEKDGKAFSKVNFFAYDENFRGGVDVAIGY